eukprot:tig00020825_g14285.t1
MASSADKKLKLKGPRVDQVRPARSSSSARACICSDVDVHVDARARASTELERLIRGAGSRGRRTIPIAIATAPLAIALPRLPSVPVAAAGLRFCSRKGPQAPGTRTSSRKIRMTATSPFKKVLSWEEGDPAPLRVASTADMIKELYYVDVDAQ